MAYPKIKVNVIKCTRVIEMETVSAGSFRKNGRVSDLLDPAGRPE